MTDLYITYHSQVDSFEKFILTDDYTKTNKHNEQIY